MKQIHKKLASALLALALICAIATPASARGWGQSLPIERSVLVWLWHYAHGEYGETRPPQEDTPSQSRPQKPQAPASPEAPPEPVKPSAPETPSAPATPQQPAGSVSALERQVVTLVNQQRAANGLPALILSEQLYNGARMKSQDMHDSRYFDHNSPNYGSPFDMMRSLGITYSAAGENIAMGYSTAEAVVNGWMNSPSHRANILSGNYTYIGVGYVANGGYWTQWFTR